MGKVSLNLRLITNFNKHKNNEYRKPNAQILCNCCCAMVLLLQPFKQYILNGIKHL